MNFLTLLHTAHKSGSIKIINIGQSIYGTLISVVKIKIVKLKIEDRKSEWIEKGLIIA